MELESKVLQYLSRYTTITKELEEAVSEGTLFKTFGKGTILLKEGSVAKACYFVLEGCIRSYRNKEGEEQTAEFYTEEQVVLPSTYGTSKPSYYNLECTEDTIVSIGSPEFEKKTFERFPQLAFLSGVIAEKLLVDQQELWTTFKTSTPEERYLNMLITRPDLLQRVPQYQIASYLGITPESLSRIRKRIVSKGKLLN